MQKVCVHVISYSDEKCQVKATVSPRFYLFRLPSNTTLWRVISAANILPHGAPSRSAAVWLTAQGTSANLISGCAGVKWELTLLNAFFKVDWGQQTSFAEVRVRDWNHCWGSSSSWHSAISALNLRLCQKSTGLNKVKFMHSSRNMTVYHCLQTNHYLH